MNSFKKLRRDINRYKKRKMASYESLYKGADDFLVPNYISGMYTPIGYQDIAGNIGMTLDGRTANQLRDINQKINPGVKVIEVQATDPGVLDSIPKHHFKEMNRLMKLTGVKPSLHAPILEASGFNREQGFDESTRVGVERQMENAVMRGHELDPNGNISVTFHSTAGLPEMQPEIRGKKGEPSKPTNFFVVDPRTGAINTIRPKKRFFPEAGKFEEKGKEPFDIGEEIKKYNQEQWIQNLSQINRAASYGEDIIESVLKKSTKDLSQEEFDKKLYDIKTGDIDLINEKEFREPLKQIQRGINHGEIYLRDAYQGMRALFDIACESASKEDKENLKKFAEKIAPRITPDMENDPKKLSEFGNIIEEGLRVLRKIETPTLVKPLNDFVIQKSAQTFGNVAAKAFDKFREKAPIINIENPPAGGGLSKAEDLKALVIESRKKFAENLVKEKGIGKSEAKKISEKMIGATWDVGHINMLRKQGYDDKELLKQTDIIAPYVKHVHLSDNFGYEHTELPMGMGNVPIKKIMERLGEKGFEGKKIVEAISWFQHFQDIPGQPPKGGGHAFSQTMQAFNSPIYGMEVSPGWGQTEGFRAYSFSAGQGRVVPPVSQSMYGAGFSPLPQEVGGPIGGDQNRFSGTPNQ